MILTYKKDILFWCFPHPSTVFFHMTAPPPTPFIKPHFIPSLSLSLTDHLHGLGGWEGAGLRSGPNVFTKVSRSEGFLPFQVFSASCKFHLFLHDHQISVFELMSLNSFDINVLSREKPRPCWKTRLAHSRLCRIDLTLDGWRSLDLCTFCQPFKWLWHEEGIGRWHWRCERIDR